MFLSSMTPRFYFTGTDTFRAVEVDRARPSFCGASRINIFQVCTSLGFMHVPCPSPFPSCHLLPLLFTSCCSPQSNIDRGQQQSKVTPSQFLMYNIVPQMAFPSALMLWEANASLPAPLVEDSVYKCVPLRSIESHTSTASYVVNHATSGLEKHSNPLQKKSKASQHISTVHPKWPFGESNNLE